MGESLGCHATRTDAAQQIAAIEANEGKAIAVTPGARYVVGGEGPVSIVPPSGEVKAKYDDIDFSPPQGVRDAARRGLEMHEEGLTGDGLEAATVAWARRIANGEDISPEKAKQGYRWWARNERFLDEEKDSPAYASAMLWFGRPGRSWFNKLWEQMEARDNEGKTLRAGDWKSYGVPDYRAGTDLKNCKNCAAWMNGICKAYNVPVHKRGYCDAWAPVGMDMPQPDYDDAMEDAIDGYGRGEMKVNGGALEIKAIDNDTITIAGYGVLFGGADLEGDTFSKSTAFALDRMKRVPVFYDHAMDASIDDEPLGYIKEMHQDDTGLWIEAQLRRNQRYADAVMQLIENKALGWSSGSVSHLVRREAGAIRSWPIVEFSLTPTPAEARLSGALSAKGSNQADEPVDIHPTTEHNGVIHMDEEKLAALLEQAVTKAVGTTVQSMRTAEEQRAADNPPAPVVPDVDELKAQNKALNDQVQQIMKLLDTEPAQRTGYVTPDGGTADKDVKSFGDFVKAIGRRDHKRLTEVYKSHKALEENSGVTGGYLVPTQFVNQLMQYAAEQAIVRPRAFTIDMAGREAEIPALDYANTTYKAGNTNFLAGMAMEWTGERKKIPDTKPLWRQMSLEAHKMSGIVPVSNELLADSGQALEQILVRLFGDAVAYAEDYAFLQGDGNGKPTGVLNAPATITTATALTAAAPTVNQLAQMYSRLMVQCRGTAVWVVHQLLADNLMNVNSTGTNVLTYLPDIRGIPTARLFGLPVLETEKLPESFANGGLLLADFRQYVVGNRQQIEIAMSSEAGDAFREDETQWRAIARVDGQPYINGAIKIGSSANSTVSAFVKSQ